jgi:predicted CXXCH cytochrome family protein
MSVLEPALRWAATLVAGLVVGVGSEAMAGIAGSAHDFTGTGWNPSGEICVVCHTPHDANLTVPDSPLWNHEVTSAVYDVYSSPTMDVPVSQPGSVSLLCLSCHDGTVALDSFGGATGEEHIGSDRDITTDLRDDHPVGIAWQHQTLDSPSCGACHIVSPSVEYFGPPFYDGNVECASCHDPHDGGAAEPGLLRRTLAGSALCLWCHGK